MRQSVIKAFALLLFAGITSCNLSTSSGPAEEVNESFTELQVGQEWIYAYWEKRHGGELLFTGDTLSVSIISKEAGLVTFFEGPINGAAGTTSDTTTFQFQIQDSVLTQVGANDSRVFGFVRNHGGALLLSQVDSVPVTVNLDTSFFLIREQTGKPKFVGHAELVDLFSESYTDVTVYYDQTPTYVDGFGHLAIFSREYGVVSTIYFGGRSPIEASGYQLVK